MYIKFSKILKNKKKNPNKQKLVENGFWKTVAMVMSEWHWSALAFCQKFKKFSLVFWFKVLKSLSVRKEISKHGLNRNFWLNVYNMTILSDDTCKTSAGIQWHGQNLLNFRQGDLSHLNKVQKKVLLMAGCSLYQNLLQAGPDVQPGARCNRTRCKRDYVFLTLLNDGGSFEGSPAF